jgi:hypothetical protein
MTAASIRSSLFLQVEYPRQLRTIRRPLLQHERPAASASQRPLLATRNAGDLGIGVALQASTRGRLFGRALRRMVRGTSVRQPGLQLQH